jgi:hypothetical protein
MGLERYVARMGEMGNEYIITVEELERKTPLGTGWKEKK